MTQTESTSVNATKELVLPGDRATPDFANGSLFFVGNATVILRYAGFTILTDPNFLHQGEHVHLGYGLRSARRTNPAIELEELPPIDFVVLSHMHEDHFDRVVEQKLNKALPIVTTHHATNKLKKKGFRSPHPLQIWETLTVVKGDAKVRITSTPGRHGPGVLAALLPPVMGSILEFQMPSGKTSFRIYISGDTLVYEDIKEIPRRYPDIDLALIHLGGTKAFGILLTMDGKQGVEAIQIIAPQTAIPIHFNDYTVMKSPLEEFMQAVTAAGLDQTVRYLSHGDTYALEIPADRIE
jgi:L-ascorbate metabolism protein UlaG (beta-lactamase superfamily)